MGVVRPGDAVSGRARIAASLRARRKEIERSALARAHGISGSVEVVDSCYSDGLRKAVSVAIEVAVVRLESGEGESDPIPGVLRAQARAAARNGIGLDTVLRRYLAGYTLFGELVMEEARRLSIQDGLVRQVSRELSALLDRLLAVVGEEYRGEEARLSRTSEQRRAERVKQLLAGELLDTSGIDYDFDVWHLGVIALGVRAERTVSELCVELDCRSLTVCSDEVTVWAWLGTRLPLDPSQVLGALDREEDLDLHIALGESGKRTSGWRLTHHQAAAALAVAQRGAEASVRYADVALLAAILRDDVLEASLRELYLAPLERERDGGRVLRKTLRAYLTTGRNVSSTAGRLGVRRQTVSDRLARVEERLGRPLDGCLAEIDSALRLAQLDDRNPAGLT